MGKIENVDCVERACVIFIGSISSPADKKISSVRQVSNPLFCMGVFFISLRFIFPERGYFICCVFSAILRMERFCLV